MRLISRLNQCDKTTNEKYSDETKSAKKKNAKKVGYSADQCNFQYYIICNSLPNVMNVIVIYSFDYVNYVKTCKRIDVPNSLFMHFHSVHAGHLFNKIN